MWHLIIGILLLLRNLLPQVRSKERQKDERFIILICLIIFLLLLYHALYLIIPFRCKCKCTKITRYTFKSIFNKYINLSRQLNIINYNIIINVEHHKWDCRQPQSKSQHNEREEEGMNKSQN